MEENTPMDQELIAAHCNQFAEMLSSNFSPSKEPDAQQHTTLGLLEKFNEMFGYLPETESICTVMEKAGFKQSMFFTEDDFHVAWGMKTKL